MECGETFTVKREHRISLSLLALLLRISSIELEGGRTWQGFQMIEVLLAANLVLGSRKVRHTRIPLSFERSGLASNYFLNPPFQSFFSFSSARTTEVIVHRAVVIFTSANGGRDKVFTISISDCTHENLTIALELLNHKSPVWK